MISVLMRIAALALVLAGCPPEYRNSSEGPAIRTDRDSYSIRNNEDALEVPIRAMFRNLSAHAVEVKACGDGTPAYVLEQWDGTTWVVADEAVCWDRRMVPVGPLDSTVFALTVRSFPHEAFSIRIDDLPAKFRLLFPVYTVVQSSEPDRVGDLLPIPRRSSAPFRIHR